MDCILLEAVKRKRNITLHQFFFFQITVTSRNEGRCSTCISEVGNFPLACAKRKHIEHIREKCFQGRLIRNTVEFHIRGLKMSNGETDLSLWVFTESRIFYAHLSNFTINFAKFM